jgi:chromosome partitioning protein
MVHFNHFSKLPAPTEDVLPGLGLVAGDLTSSAAGDEFSGEWPDCLDREPRAFRMLSGAS